MPAAVDAACAVVGNASIAEFGAACPIDAVSAATGAGDRDTALSDRIVAGLCALLMRPGRMIRSAIVFKPSTLLSLHRALTQRKYRRLLFSNVVTRPGPKG